jgi:serine-type D-Ala-D-Ala carboxypeptidase (penicillin-binding protein 5/6)
MSRYISLAYRKPQTGWQHRAALTGSMSHTGTSPTPRGGLAALLAALAFLAGCSMAQPDESPFGTPASAGPVTWPAATPTAGAAAGRGRLGAVSWPASGTSAADISGYGVTGGPGATRVVPIASVAKLMTAYVIVRDHPLTARGAGPDITIQPPEAAAYQSQRSDGDSLVPVAAGEVLTERQALEALLLPSADNIAWVLARWDAGGQGAFTAKMNAAARGLGMTATRYTDPSGLDSATTSTAADQVRLGTAAMSVPALAAITAQATADIPVAGTIRNTNEVLGQDGIVGLKTGSTEAAGGCLLAAAWSEVNGREVLIVAAAFGQPGTAATILPRALQAGHDLILALEDALRAGRQSRSRDGSGNPPQGPPGRPGQ